VAVAPLRLELGFATVDGFAAGTGTAAGGGVFLFSARARRLALKSTNRIIADELLLTVLQNDLSLIGSSFVH
jgi:hypothetical protein